MSDGRLPTRRRWAGWTIAVVAVVIVFAVSWVVVRGFGAFSELQNLRHSAAQLRSAIDERAYERAERIAPRIADHAALAHDLTSDPIWRGFEFIPWLGQNLTAVREVAEIADDVADDAVAPIVALAPDVDLATLGFAGSRIDLTTLPTIAEPLADAASALAGANARARLIDAEVSLPPIADAVREAKALLRDAASNVGALHDASLLLPGMLGGSEPRTYLIAVQNNAELRSQGGAIAALVLVSADDGAISIDRAMTGHDLPSLKDPAPTDDAVVALFGDAPGRVARDLTSIPEFSLAGEHLAQRWQDAFGGKVDGVVAVDIETMRRILAATGGVTFDGFSATDRSLVSILTAEVPATAADPRAQDAAFAHAATAVLTAALSSQEPAAVLAALSGAATDDRIRVWSARPEEQELLAASSLAGAPPTDGESASDIGVLFNDRTGAPLGAYADATISTAIGTCEGAPTTQVRVTWTSEVPEGIAAAAPAPADGAPGDIRTLIAVYGPDGSTVRGGATTAMLGARPVVQQDVTVSPGESTTVTATFTGGGAGERVARVHHTPLLASPDVVRADVDCG
ncbi:MULTISPECIES: DUF4012 domain-containing protein [unclassified Microbacterium]|uniref:DUF4012 domain-containing protein n=1 Tax=unclassified Microbacterium TaxID=2609290 RepID=UPI001E5131FF|nr:DUF4012 domain-containing protein [Microbacterium sp. Bi121]